MNPEENSYDSDQLSSSSKATKLSPHPFDTLSCLIMPSDGGVGISGNSGNKTNAYDTYNQSAYIYDNNLTYINNGSNIGVNNNILPNYLVDQTGNLILLNGFSNNNILVNNIAPQNLALYNIPTNQTKSEFSNNGIYNNNLSLFDNNALQQLYLSQSSLVSHIANNNQSTVSNASVNTDPYLNLLQQNVALIGQIINTNHEILSPTKLSQHSTPIKTEIHQQKLNSVYMKNDLSKAKVNLQTKYLQRGTSSSHSTKIEATLKSFVDEHFKDMESTWKTNVPPLHPPSKYSPTELLKLTGHYKDHNGVQDAKKHVKYETLKFKTKPERVKIKNRRYFEDDTSYNTTKISFKGDDGNNMHASYGNDEDFDFIENEEQTSSPLRSSLSGGAANRRVMTRGGLPPKRQSRAGHERPFNRWYDRGRTSVRSRVSRDARDWRGRNSGHVTSARSNQAPPENDDKEEEEDPEELRIAQLIGCELEAYIRDFEPEPPTSPLPTKNLYGLWEADLGTPSSESHIIRQIDEEKNALLKIGTLKESGFFCESIETTLNPLAFTDPIQALAMHTTTVDSNQSFSKVELTTTPIPQSNAEEIPPASIGTGEEIVEENASADKNLILDEDSNPIAPLNTTTTPTSVNSSNAKTPRSLVISTEKTHENYMLEEMAWLSTDFLQEHKWKMTVARKVSRGIQKYFEERVLRDEKLKQEEMNYLKKIASRVSKLVWRFWRSISRIADAKAKAILEIKHQRHLDRQLNAIVGETEKYSDQISKQLLPPAPPPTTPSTPLKSPDSKKVSKDAEGPTLSKKRVRASKDKIEAEPDEASSKVSPTDPRRTSPRKFPVVKIHKLTEKSETSAVVSVQASGQVKRRKRRSADCILITESSSTDAITPALAEQVRPSVIITQKVQEVKTPVIKQAVRSLRSQHLGPINDATLTGDKNGVVDVSPTSVQLNGARESVIKSCKPVRNGCIRVHSNGTSSVKSVEERESKSLHLCGESAEKEPLNTPIDARLKGTPPKLSFIKEESEESYTDDSSTPRSAIDIKEEELSFEIQSEEVKGDISKVEDASKDSINEIEPESSNPTEITDIAAQAQKFQPKGFTLATTEVCTKVPFLLKHTLREYQHIGLDWLVAMHNKNLNGILADEMGLGKTIQTISLLAHLACEKGIWGPHLIVVPTSVMLNWEMEFKKWCPGFKILTYFGSPKERRMKRRGWGFDASESRETPNVVITSYRLVLQDERCFKRKRWSYFILDEAQNIKNFKSRRWLTLLNFKADHRLLLTGTPLQNDLMEVWSLMHFLMPRVFANRSEFSHWFVKPLQDLLDSSGQDPGSGSSRCMDASEILKGGPGGSTSLIMHTGPSVAEAQALVAKLHKILRPFILRRLKREVEKQMPGKFEHVVACRLSKRQRYLYHDFVSRASTRQILESGNFLGVVNALMQLRKVCNHPDLFEERPICSPLVTGRIVYYTAPSLATTALRDDFKISSTTSPDSDTPETLEVTENSRLKCFKLQGAKPYQSHRLPNCVHEISSRALFNLLQSHEPKYQYVGALSSALSSSQIVHFEKPSSTCDQQPFNIRGLFRTSNCLTFPKSNRILEMLSSTGLANRTINVNDRSLNGSELYTPLLNRLVMHDTNSYLESLQPILERFMIYIPAVTSLSPDLHVSHPSVPDMISRQSLLYQTENCLRLGLASMPLFRIITNARALRFPEIRLIEYDCGKLQVLKDLLAKLQIDKHRVLIFTQMTKVLDILEAFLTYHGYRYLRLDGSTKIEQRQIMMDRFNYDQKIFCFILSTRSGGLGINLTGADTVIFYDSDWNPTMDAQAQDRCHRIGQTREVHIYRLISRYTVEENILKKARQKKLLGDITIEEGNFTTAFFRQDGLKDLFALKSSEELAGEEEKKIINLDEEIADASMESGKPEAKSSWFEEALGMAEDEADSKAARLAAREIPLDNEDLKAEFAEPNDDSILEDGVGGQGNAKPELTPEEQCEKDLPEELKLYISNLKPIEKVALRIYEHLNCAELYEASPTEEEVELENSESREDIELKEEGSGDENKSQDDSTETESEENVEFGTISSFYSAKNDRKEEQTNVDTKTLKRRRRKRFKAFRLSMPKRIKK